MPHSRQPHALNLVWLSEGRAWIRHQVPFLGCIITAKPELQERQTDGCIQIDSATLRLPNKTHAFALKVRGDSMHNAGILEGDIAILEFRKAKHGDIVAALIDGELTLKRYILQAGGPHLRASNPKFPELIPAEDVNIQGVQIALLRLSPNRQLL